MLSDVREGEEFIDRDASFWLDEELNDTCRGLPSPEDTLLIARAFL